MDRASRLWILGVPDPEMTAIEQILTAGETWRRFVPADGRPLTGASAYGLDAEIGVGGPGVVWVECGPSDREAGVRSSYCPCEDQWDNACVLDGRDNCCRQWAPVPRCDHHRPGDPGAGAPPECYWSASSIGQVCARLELDRCRACGDRIDMSDRSGHGGAPCMGLADQRTPGGMGGCGDLHDWPLTPAEYAHLRLVAGGDHCPGHAYAGLCPGVEPQALMAHRAQTRAAFQHRPVEAVLADVEAARVCLMHAPAIEVPEQCCEYHAPHCDPTGVDPGCGCRFGVTVRDCRGPAIAELPEAALRDGIAYVASVTERDGRTKWVLGAADAIIVRAFRAWAAAEGCTEADIYGDAARGFAGCYPPRYRVVRTATYPDCHTEISVCWAGHDPATYTGAIGCVEGVGTMDGADVAIRELQELCADGRYHPDDRDDSHHATCDGYCPDEPHKHP